MRPGGWSLALLVAGVGASACGGSGYPASAPAWCAGLEGEQAARSSPIARTGDGRPDARERRHAECLLWREAPRALGVPEASVVRVTPTLPFAYVVDLDNHLQRDVLVMDGRIVHDRRESNVRRYLELVRFFERRWPEADTLAGLLTSYGAIPARFVGPHPRGPGGERTELRFDDRGAVLVLYGAAAWPEEIAGGSGTGVRVAGGGGGYRGERARVRATLRITRSDLRFDWRMDRSSPPQPEWVPWAER